MDGIAITAILGGIGTIFGVFLKYITGRDKAQEKRDHIFATALAANTKAMEAVAVSSEKVAKETAKGNREAKERNGHLGEQNVQITKLIAGQNKDIAAIRESSQKAAVTLKANTEKVANATHEVAAALLKKDTTQHIEEQTVVHQTVENKE